jgi:hypothetical protein
MRSTLFDLLHGEMIRECFSSTSSSATNNASTSRKDSPDGVRTLERLGYDVASRLVRALTISFFL